MSRTAAATDMIALLRQDHKEVKAMFEEFLGLGERAFAKRRDVGSKIVHALESHSQIEEQILYPAFKQRAEGRDELEMILEAFEEHALVDGLVAQVKDMDAHDERYEAKINTIMDLVLHHVREEEGELFPTVRELFERNELLEMAQLARGMREQAGAR
jgi:hemerythrin superfamily protein